MAISAVSEVTDFPNHDHVGILSEDVTQTHGKGQADIRFHRNLIDPLELVFHRILNGNDPFGDRVDGARKA